MESNLTYLTFNEVGITFAAIAAACAFIVLVWNCIKAIKEWITSLRRPTDEHIDSVEARVEDHEQRIGHLEECCEEVQGKLQFDWQYQKEQTDVNRMVLKSLKSLLQHAVDGNDTKKLEAQEQEIDQFLLEHMK